MSFALGSPLCGERMVTLGEWKKGGRKRRTGGERCFNTRRVNSTLGRFDLKRFYQIHVPKVTTHKSAEPLQS